MGPPLSSSEQGRSTLPGRLLPINGRSGPLRARTRDPSPSPARASPPARPALGAVDSVMSPGLALRRVGSRGSSAGGFRRAGLARREAGRTASRRARIAQAGPGARRSVSRRPTPFRSRPRTSCPGPRRPTGAAPVIPGRVPRRGDPPAAGRRHPLRRPPAVRGTATRQARGGGAVPNRVRSSGAGGSRPPDPHLVGAPRTSRESHAPHRSRSSGRSFNLPEGRLSKSVAKAPTGPERRKRIVDIPRFFSRPIPPRDVFVADLDTPSPRAVPGAPPAPPRARPSPPPQRRRTHGPSRPVKKAHCALPRRTAVEPGQ